MNTKTENWNNHQICFIEKEAGEWWAVAEDIAEALEYSRTADMVRIISVEEKETHNVRVGEIGNRKKLIISELGIYEAIFNSRRPEAKEFKRWVFQTLKEIRQASGLASYEIFRMLDKEHQKQAMNQLKEGLHKATKVDYIKANTIANKAVSTYFGFSKMVRKPEMTADMLTKRQEILDDTVGLMATNESFKLGLPISDTVYGKYV